jgi:hypothetical protein
MTNPWFVRAGWFHRPVSWQGFVVVLAAAAFCVQVFVAVDGRSHSISDTLYGVFPFFVPAFLLLDWIAGRTGAAGDRGNRDR